MATELGGARRDSSFPTRHPEAKTVGGTHVVTTVALTTPDWYRVQRDFSSHLAGRVIFSKVDLVCGYHQVPFHPLDVPKTLVTLFGLFEFLRMPFGRMQNAQLLWPLYGSPKWQVGCAWPLSPRQ